MPVCKAGWSVIDNGLSYNNFNPIHQAGMIGSILILLMLAETLVGPGRRRAAPLR